MALPDRTQGGGRSQTPRAWIEGGQRLCQNVIRTFIAARVRRWRISAFTHVEVARKRALGSFYRPDRELDERFDDRDRIAFLYLCLRRDRELKYCSPLPFDQTREQHDHAV